MTDPLTTAGVLAAAAVYVSKTAYEMAVKLRISNNGNDEVGKRCRADVLQASMDMQTRLLTDIKESQMDTRDGVKKLVILAESR